MPTAPCIRRERRHGGACGLAGLLAAAVLVVVMRHYMAPTLTLAVAVVPGAGWARRRAPGAATRSRPGDVS